MDFSRMTEPKLYLGLDLSSQKLKGIVINDRYEIVVRDEIQFDCDLPEFGTVNGFVEHGNGTVTSPVLMWVKSIDLLLAKLANNSTISLGRIHAICGCAQQHGTVYWRKGESVRLTSADSEKTLAENLSNSFSFAESPVWKDSSTKTYCEQLENFLGGPEKVANATGSICYERFSAAQILKKVRESFDSYRNTEKITLISNFICSILLGEYAPFETADASGMNMMSLAQKKWHEPICKFIDPHLIEKLNDISNCYVSCGQISDYFRLRYGFRSDCRLFPFTGDNLASFVALNAATLTTHSGGSTQSTIVLSLGTSDTIFLSLERDSFEQRIVRDGHLFANPLDSNGLIGLLCFKNGSIVREKFCEKFANGSWKIFNDLLRASDAGNLDRIGLFYDDPEIVPRGIHGEFRYDRFDCRIETFDDPRTEIRALIEGQILAKKYHIMETFRYKFDSQTKIIVTGGASTNDSFLQIIANIFQCFVYGKNEPNSAALGACYLAKFGSDRANSSENFCAKIGVPTTGNDRVFEPDRSLASLYDRMIERYRNLISKF